MNDYDNYKEYAELKEELAHLRLMQDAAERYDRMHGYDD